MSIILTVLITAWITLTVHHVVKNDQLTMEKRELLIENLILSIYSTLNYRPKAVNGFVKSIIKSVKKIIFSYCPLCILTSSASWTIAFVCPRDVFPYILCNMMLQALEITFVSSVEIQLQNVPVVCSKPSICRYSNWWYRIILEL